MRASELKLHLLIEGMALDYDSFAGLDFKTDKYLHNDRHVAQKAQKASVPQELCLVEKEGQRLCVGVLARPQSRFRLEVRDGHPQMTCNSVSLDVGVDFVPEPMFWGRTTSDGIPFFKMLSVPGFNELNLWTWHDCAYHYEKVGCTFCTTTSTAKQAGTGRDSALATAYKFIEDKGDGSASAVALLPDLLRRSTEALQAALEEDFGDYWFTIIGGNVPNLKISAQQWLVRELIAGLVANVPALKRDRVVANVMPPTAGGELEALRAAGATVFMGNMEIWDADVFQRVCPGKALYGRDIFIRRLWEAADIYGRGNAWCNFVCGLEPMAAQLEGIETLASKGVVCGANVFHHDPFVKADAASDFSADSVRDYYVGAAKILRAHGLQPFYSMQSRRSSLLWEAYLGYLD